MCRLRLQAITCTIVIFGMFSGQRSTLGNGLSGEPRCGNIAVWQLCRERQPLMAWIWHVWINAMVFVPTAKAPPKSWRKRIIIQQSEFLHERQRLIIADSILFRTKLIYLVLPHMEMNTVCLEKLSHGNRQRSILDISVFLWLRKQGQRFAQG